MSKVTWIRLSLASALVVGGGAALSVTGCSEEETTLEPTQDGGTTPTKDSGTNPTTDGGTDAGPRPYPKIHLVHAGSGVGNVRFCMSANNTFISPVDVPLPTAADLPSGLPPGAGGPLKVDPALAGGIPSYDVKPYLIEVSKQPDADKTKKCGDIIKAGQALPDYVHDLGTIAKNTLAPNKTYVVAVLGCAKAQSDVQRCGAGYDDSKGNLRVALFELDRTAPTGTSSGVQFLHLSPKAQAMQFPIGGGNFAAIYSSGILPGVFQPAVVPDGGTDPDGGDPDASTGDGGAAGPTVHAIGTSTPFKWDDNYGANTTPVQVPAASTIPGLAGNPLNKLGLWTALGRTGDPPVSIAMPLVVGATLGVDGTGNILPPGFAYLENAKNYTFIAIGDPSKAAPPSGTDPEFFRVIALQNDPNTTP